MPYDDIITQYMTLPQANSGLSTKISGMLGLGGASMPNPYIIPALISGGGNLLSGLLSGIQKGKQAKELKVATQPKTKFYESFKVLPELQQIFQKSLLGAMSDMLGEDVFNRWGIADIIPRLYANTGIAQRSNPYQNILQNYAHLMK